MGVGAGVGFPKFIFGVFVSLPPNDGAAVFNDDKGIVAIDV